MTQVLLNIDNQKKWNQLKTVLEAMEIDYATQDNTLISPLERDLITRAQSDKEHGRLYTFTQHRDILAQK